MSSGTLADWPRALKEAAWDEFSGEAERRRKAKAREEVRQNRELPGRVVTHRFMRAHQHRLAGMLAPCIRRWGDKHQDICDALEWFRTRGKKRGKK